jgi:protein-S-isoprenylcysteine O-methyltransferase Ste14
MLVTPGSGEGQPDAEREARRAARSERREAPAERPGMMTPSGRRRLPLEAQLKHVVTTGGIVGIGIVVVVVAAIMTSQDSKGWLIGLVVSIVSIGLAALLWSSRRL